MKNLKTSLCGLLGVFSCGVLNAAGVETIDGFSYKTEDVLFERTATHKYNTTCMVLKDKLLQCTIVTNTLLSRYLCTRKSFEFSPGAIRTFKEILGKYTYDNGARYKISDESASHLTSRLPPNAKGAKGDLVEYRVGNALLPSDFRFNSVSILSNGTHYMGVTARSFNTDIKDPDSSDLSFLLNTIDKACE